LLQTSFIKRLRSSSGGECEHQREHKREHQRGHQQCPSVRLLSVVLLAGVLATFAAPSANAVEMASLYTTQVLLDPEEGNPRAVAYEQALREVLTRVSGSQVSADPELFELLFPNPAVYVVQFRPGPEDTLFVSFDGDALESLLRRSGQLVWGNDRPLTIVWLAVDWGQGEREIIAVDDPEDISDEERSIDQNRLLRERVLEVAARRGLPILFPLLDIEDLQSVSFSDIWGGFDEQVLEASKRYDANSVLVGRIRPESSQRNDWSYYFSGEERNWTGEPEEVLSLVGDVLAAEFAIGGNAPLQTFSVGVSGIDSIDAYGAVQQILGGVSLIEAFTISRVEGGRIRYNITIRGDADRLIRALRFNGLIEQDVIDARQIPQDFGSDDLGLQSRSNSSLEFFYSP
jgi:hypothetical protein